MWHRRRRRLLRLSWDRWAGCMQNLRRIVNFFGLAGVESEDLETSQTPPVQQFRQAFDIVEQKLRAAELDFPRLEELVEQPRGVQHTLSEKLSQAWSEQEAEATAGLM